MKLKFPYGICDFERISTEKYLYIDRTDRLAALEEVGNILFLRPRRFGKSLLLSMLENYYDLAKADKFEALFGHLAVGQNPTPKHNQYFVMKWDFSMVDPQGNSTEIKQSLYNHINQQIEFFGRYYRNFLEYEIKINETDALASFQSLLSTIRLTPHRLYLLIDEYDNFANEVMISQQRGQQRYEEMLYGEGMLKTLFKVIKATAAGMGLERFFITGVSPIVMSDMTSGQNIAHNIYFKTEFNDLCGFREDEVAQIFQQVATACHLSPEKMAEGRETMRTFYNGYCFEIQAAKIYNPTLALYFLEELQDYCRYPREMLDQNLASDRKKLEYVASIPRGERVIMQAINEQEPLTIPQLVSRFGVREMYEAGDDDTFAASLLYYLGALTLAGITTDSRLILKVPNLVMRGLYFERLQRILLPHFKPNDINEAATVFYRDGDLRPTCELIEKRLSVLDNRDYRQANELLIKTIFLSVLFNDLYYMVDSETALQRGYADLTMILRPDMRQYRLFDHVVEFKFVKLKDTGLNGAAVQAISEAELNALEPVQQQLAEGKEQLARYRQALAEIYGDKLRLQTHVVVSIGFERLVWVGQDFQQNQLQK